MWALSNLCQLGKIWKMFQPRWQKALGTRLKNVSLSAIFSFPPTIFDENKMLSTSILFGYPILSRWNLLQPVPIFARHACFYTNWQKPSVSFNIISIRKLTSFFSWVKIAKGKTGGSSEQTKPFAVSFCAGWKYLAIGHCRFTTSFWLCLFEDRKDQMYLSGMFCEKVRQSLYK